MSDLPAAGWYADPEYPGHLRYWDGQAWTEYRQPDAVSQAAGTAAAPAVDPAGTPATPTAASGIEPAAEPADTPSWAEPEVVRSSPPGAAGPAPAGAWDGTARPVGRRQGLGAPVVTVIVILALLLGGIGGFTLGRLTADEDGPAPLAGGTDTVGPGDRVTLELDGGSVSTALVLQQDHDVRIEARSSDFDTTLTLFDDRGNELAFDDDGLDEDLNSMIAQFLEAGRYEIVVAPFERLGVGMRGSVEVTIH